MKTTGSTLLVVLVVALALLMTFASGAMSAPKRVEKAKPGDCSACHGSEKVLPPNHQDTKDMNYGACSPCHPKTGKGSLSVKLPGSHAHNLLGVSCEQCHGKGQNRQAVEMKQCLACHNPDKLVEKTAKVKPENPHTSPHYGNTLDCNLCHHQHAKSENFCGQCHSFDFTVP